MEVMRFIALALIGLSTISAAAVDSLVLVGTYSKGKSEGIYAYKFSSATGKLTSLGLATKASNPSYLVIHPNRRWVYAVGENDNGTLASYTLDEGTGKQTAMNTVSSKGAAPCHLSIDKTGKFLLAANYNGGNVGIFPIGADGHLANFISKKQNLQKEEQKRLEKDR